MSFLLIRPPSPVPFTLERSTLCSRAILRTSGEERSFSSARPKAGGAAAAVGEAFAGVGAEAASRKGLAGPSEPSGTAFADSGAPCPSMMATTVLTATVSFSEARIFARIPSAGEGISASTLSVVISNRGSSRSTCSPGFFSHLMIVPSATLSPIWGITTLVGIRILDACSRSRSYSTASSRLQAAALHLRSSERWAGNTLRAAAKTELEYPAL